MSDLAPLEEIQSVTDLAKVLSNSNGIRRLLFRGQNIDKALLPKIARIAKKKDMTYDATRSLEKRMLERFRREAVPYLREPKPTTDWEWLSVAQHQGLPTRLLDWTANALAGLWFAVSSPPQDSSRGVLWVLEVSEGHERALSKEEDLFDLKRTFVSQPFHMDRRISAQSAWFSIHRYSQKDGKWVALNRNSKFKRALRKYAVPLTSFERIRADLRLMGVTEAALFPDLSGLCADIQAELATFGQPVNAI